MRPLIRVLLAIFVVMAPVTGIAGAPDLLATGRGPVGHASQEKPRSTFPDRNVLFRDLRMHLAKAGAPAFTTNARLPVEIGCDTQIYVTVFQRGEMPVRWGTKDCDADAALTRIVRRIQQNSRFDRNSVSNLASTRLLFEYVVSSKDLSNFSALTENEIGEYRFEPGITGFRFRYDGKTVYYMPTEAYMRSHMSLDQLFSFLTKRVRAGGAISTFMDEATEIEMIESRAFVSHGKQALPLYRGYPLPLQSSRSAFEDSMQDSVDWLVRNQKPSGKFLYYYDAASDSTADFQHPRNPDYYNILRHSGGIIALLRAFELKPDAPDLEPIRRSIAYLLSKSVVYQDAGQKRRHIFYNNKSKLGGTGLALVALMHYYRLTDDDRYLGYADELASHLLSQILPDGEFQGYFIHPQFNDGKPLVDVTMAERRQLFSFYYPGEALLGLALYERHAPLEAYRKAEVRSKSRSALDFLIYERPKRYAEHFLSLPADAWLMQAIEEWWYHPEMRNPDYAGFVFDDALQMIAHMYRPEDAPYPDYVGHFYYSFGEHAIPDASRAEGLMAAFMLASRQGNEPLARLLMEKMWLIAVGLQQTYNSQQAMYAAKYPEKAVGAFRFKLTRQWVRVDSVQHAACFYARLLMALAREGTAMRHGTVQ